MPLLNVFWAMLWFFLFIIWIWLLISVFADIFRSDDLSGWAKGLWVIFVVLVPYLGVFVYLIARGGGMQERSMMQVAAREKAQRAYIQSVSGSGGSTAAELAKLAELKDKGVLSEAEFAAEKAKLLG